MIEAKIKCRQCGKSNKFSLNIKDIDSVTSPVEVCCSYCDEVLCYIPLYALKSSQQKEDV